MPYTPSPRIQRLQKRYTDTALGCFNFLILFVVINVALGFGFSMLDKAAVHKGSTAAIPLAALQSRLHVKNPVHLADIDEDAFEGVPQAELEALINDMDDNPAMHFEYESWVEFRNSPGHTRTINNDVLDNDTEFTFRRSILKDELRPANPEPAIEVYIFGGSTVWGTFAADGWTLGSCLWNALQQKAGSRPVRIYNFGRVFNYSSQEVVLFRRLLEAGHVPKIAVFLDGLNDVPLMADMADKPGYHKRLTELMETAQVTRPKSDLEMYQWVPLVRLAFEIRQRLAKKPDSVATPTPQTIPAEKKAAFILDRYRNNRDLARYLASKYGVQVHFFWQPVPFYHYDPKMSKHYPLNAPELKDIYQVAYDAMREDKQTVFLGDLLQEYDPGHHPFVDQVHYGPRFAQFLADRMARSIDLP